MAGGRGGARRASLGGARPPPPACCGPTSTSPALILASSSARLERLAARHLGALDDETEASRARLLDTLSAWLGNLGGIAPTADQLDVHPQTVRYRIARLRELLGEQLDDPDARFELQLALRGRGLHR